MANESDPRIQRYRAWLLKQPCACQPCVAPVIIHHSTVGETAQHAKSIPGRRGKGQRASDDEGISVCQRHHANFHDLRGYFEGWEKQQLRDWQNSQVERLQRLFHMAHPEPIASPTPAGVARRASTKSPDVVKLSTVLEYITTWSGKRHLAPDTVQALSDLQNDLKASLP